MGYTTYWRKLSASQLNIAIQAFSLISIFFEGYDQGVMGGVNSSPRYVEEVGIGNSDGKITDTLHEGGIVSIYYLGCIVGSFVGGWLADRIGRINGLWIGAVFTLVGGALQAATQSSDFILVARIVTDLGTGALTGITPVLVSETSSASHRGGFLGYVFIANYLGISVAYWLSFGLAFINNGYSDIRWRFLLAFQCIPALLLLLGIKALPDSPRYLASVGRYDDAREVLTHVRGGYTPDVEQEFLEIVAVAKESKPSSPIMASWSGITAVTAYSPTLLRAAGYSTLTQNGLAGDLNTVGIIGTIISANIVDRLGRRKCLMLGSFGLFAVNLIAASLYEASRSQPQNAGSFAPAAVAMLFLFNLIYASTWGTVAFLIPTEIWSSDMRAQGNGFGITGWAIGVGMTVLVNPVMFAKLENRTYFLFAGLNLLWIPIVYLFYPETAGRSLESIGALFSTNSPFNWHMEQAYRNQGELLEKKGVPDVEHSEYFDKDKTLELESV
ncbi:unnamed protein product [Alternaria alternata]